ncbi:unnamed protein product [Hymenolepis diminuta]|uniref:Uncharacterized protein n=1 Tax=Hymenolepis diminuta TaxID=6216 RepID=A0A158QDL1_HYMDI|nr:unnamed protein product [Hymenolepis diminuta]
MEFTVVIRLCLTILNLGSFLNIIFSDFQNKGLGLLDMTTILPINE